jgi:hypothetical protein
MIGSRLLPAAGVAALIALVAAPAQGQGDTAAFVVLGPGGEAVARVVTAAPACPRIVIDGRARRMRLRAGPATEPLRPTRSTPELSKPSAFPVNTCETVLRRTARSVRVAGRRLPLPRARYHRIVVIGDTGCRVKASDNAYQACNDPKAYPFAEVSRAAAAWRPQLVIHVGDYLYRENPCPDDHPGCAGMAWGYGWDGWRDDFFGPAAPLLAAAPWVVARGNHENCARAGQGWWRFLEPRPYLAGRDCNAAADDAVGDRDDPYAVPIGGGVQLAVLDLANAPNDPIPPASPLYAQFADSWRKLDALSRNTRSTILVLHHPVLGLRAPKPGMAAPSTGGINSVFKSMGPDFLPPRVKLVLAGHVHLWEQVSFSSNHPSQFIAGFAGTQEDTVPLPETLPPDVTPVEGAVVEKFASWVDGFGFMTMTRTGLDRWLVEIHGVDGKVRNRCRVTGRRSSCDLDRVKNR